MTNRKIARRYSLALYEVAEELNMHDKVKTDIDELKASIDNSNELKLFFKSPIINSQKKRKIISDLLSGKISELTIKFIDILCMKNRENLIHDICVDYLDLVNERKGILVTDITTVVNLSDKEKDSLVNKLKNFTGKDINAKFSIDESIKGGFVAKFKDTIIDASIMRQLELLREEFKKGSFQNN